VTAALLRGASCGLRGASCGLRVTGCEVFARAADHRYAMRHALSAMHYALAFRLPNSFFRLFPNSAFQLPTSQTSDLWFLSSDLCHCSDHSVQRFFQQASGTPEIKPHKTRCVKFNSILQSDPGIFKKSGRIFDTGRPHINPG